MGNEKMCVYAARMRDGLIKNHHAKPFCCQTKDNITLNGLIIEREKPLATLLLCHGYRCCKELTANYADMFPEYNVVLFDFRGHGENKRTITTIGCHEYKDVITVSRWLKKNKPQLNGVPFIILGVSMGGASALKATAQEPALCDALIIDSAFSSLRSVLYHAFTSKSGLPTFPFMYIMEKMFCYLGACDINAMQPLKSVKKIKQPLMLIHSCIDRFVPVQESLLMYAQTAKMGAKLWIGPACKHGYLHKDYPELYKKKVNRFLHKRVFSNG